MKDLESISKILGIHMTTQWDNIIKTNQHHYIQQMLAEFSMKHSKPAPVLLSPSINLKNQDNEILNTKDHEIFRCLISKLIFMAISIRIDITFAVNRLS